MVAGYDRLNASLVVQPSKRLSAEEARAKATECLRASKSAARPDHKTMLEHMSHTWEQVATSLENGW
jgi:hypothetical protein